MADDPVVTGLAPYVTPAHPPRVAVYGRDVRLNALVVSTGMVRLSGLTVHPDRSLWERLNPGQNQQWSNYGKYAWIADLGRTTPTIRNRVGTERDLLINPCTPGTRALRINLSISPQPLTESSCLSLAQTVDRSRGRAYVYRYAQPWPGSNPA